MIIQCVTLLMTLHVYTKAQFHPMGMGLPPAMPMPMGMPPMPMQMPIGGPPQMPVVVMPYHSRTADRFRGKPKKSKPKKSKPKKDKKKHNRYESDSDSDSSSSSGSSSSWESSSDEKNFRTTKDHHKTHKRRRQVLTPVVSYVTKDGYVVYQKKIKKDRAKDWLELGKNSNPNEMRNGDEESDIEEFDPRKEKGRKKHRSKSHH